MFKTSVFPAGLLTAAILVSSASAQAEMATPEMLTNTCIACHGPGGASRGPGIPSLTGMTKNYFVGAMLAYKYDNDADGLEKILEELEKTEEYEDISAFARYSTIMGRIAKGYTLEEIQSMALMFEGSKPTHADQAFNKSMAAKGGELHEEHCDKCHEDRGLSSKDDVGVLAGQWKPYLMHSLTDFMEGRREMPKKMKKQLKEVHKNMGMAGIEQLIEYYASVK